MESEISRRESTKGLDNKAIFENGTRLEMHVCKQACRASNQDRSHSLIDRGGTARENRDSILLKFHITYFSVLSPVSVKHVISVTATVSERNASVWVLR